VLPQAMRTVIPPLINVFIALTKNTSVAAAFGVTELTQIAQRLGGVYAGIDVIAVFLAASIGYLVITIPSGIIAGRVERRVAFAR
jgi:glutamate transport system permease protein